MTRLRPQLILLSHEAEKKFEGTSESCLLGVGFLIIVKPLFSLSLEGGCGRHLAVADSEKRLHIVDVTRNFFRRVTYDSDWPITLAEQALFVNTLTQQANSSQASGVGGREEPGNPMDVLLSDPTTRSPSCTASLRNVCWLSPEKSKMLLLAASFENFLVIFKVLIRIRNKIKLLVKH